MADAPETRLVRLRALVEADLAVVADVVERLAQVATRAAGAPSDADRMAMGGYLHHAYTGIEAALERIVREIDGAPPVGPRSHRELLELSRVAIPSVRPAIVTASTFDALDRLLSFRHAYRHGYAMRLEPSRLAPLVAEARPTLDAVRRDLAAFWAAIGVPAA